MPRKSPNPFYRDTDADASAKIARDQQSQDTRRGQIVEVHSTGTAKVALSGSATSVMVQIMAGQNYNVGDWVWMIRDGARWQILGVRINSLTPGISAGGSVPVTSSSSNDTPNPTTPSSQTLTAEPGLLIYRWTSAGFRSDLIYEVQVANDNLATGAVNILTAGGELSYSVPPGTTKYFRVRTVDSSGNKSGWSVWSNTTATSVSLTGDITGSGWPSITATLATVNANVGVFSRVKSVTANAKGLITAITQGLVDLASEITGILGLTNGGTGSNLSSTGPGYLLQSSSGANVTVIKNNLTATRNPVSSDDVSQGYSNGSQWINALNKTEWVCVKNSSGSGATWKETTAASGGVLERLVVYASSDIPMATAGTYYDGISVTISPGTWLIMGTTTCSNAAPATFSGKLWDGTTIFSFMQNLSSISGLSFSTVISPSIETTYKISVSSDVDVGTIISTNRATQLIAIRLATVGAGAGSDTGLLLALL